MSIVTQGALIPIYIYIINKTYRTDFDWYKENSLTLTLSNPQLDWVETLLQARMVPREPGKGNFFIFVAPVLRCSVLAFSIFFLLGQSPLFSRAGDAFPSFSWAFALQTTSFSLLHFLKTSLSPSWIWYFVRFLFLLSRGQPFIQGSVLPFSFLSPPANPLPN